MSTEINTSSIIRRKLNLPISHDISIYLDLDKRKYYTPKICDIVNEYIPKLNYDYDIDLFNEIEENGYAVIENFLDESQINNILNYFKNIKGYNFHTPNRSLNKIPQVFSDDLDWNICSYKSNHVLANSEILKAVTDPKIISIVQKYLGCMPCITTANLWWNKNNGVSFHTQKIHRDLNDFKFLAFFIYLTDVNEDNGPHVYYKKTHKGSESLDDKVVVEGKAGTAILGDTFALHNGKELKNGKRLFLSIRYTLHINNNFYRDDNFEYLLPQNMYFDIIDDTPQNRYLLSPFTLEMNNNE